MSFQRLLDMLIRMQHRCKKRFLCWSRFYVLTFFFIFQHVFYFLKNVGKVQSGKQINKKHFQNNSNETDLWFFCCMSNDLKCLPINFYLVTIFDALCDGLKRPFLGHQAWSWTTLRRCNFFVTFTNVFFFISVTFFTFLTCFIFIWTFFYIYGMQFVYCPVVDMLALLGETIFEWVTEKSTKNCRESLGKGSTEMSEMDCAVVITSGNQLSRL